MFDTIFVPVDNSEHSETSIDLAIKLGQAFDARLVGSHAYAARMHDYRFKQMEFTLPEEYLVEEEMEKQRKIHDSLITMGLELISESYLVVMQKRVEEANLAFKAKMYDGKNFQVITKDILESDYDLVIMGALGLGAVRDSQIGSVCERVVRRTRTDTIVVKNTAPIEEQLSATTNGVAHSAGGGIVVALDGSPESYAGLKTALQLGKEFNKSVEAISVYDPYLHYAMFNSLVSVLTEKAAKVFKFEEQEQLHEDVIDTGLAKIYQSHLEVAKKLAEEDGFELKITLLDGKAFEKILEYVRREKPWMLVMGRIGVHSDESMDIGSNTENLLRMAPCNVYLSSKRFQPHVDIQAEESIFWTEPAQNILEKAPDFARGIARTIIHRWAMERGHSVITTKVVEEAMSTILPKSSMEKMGIIAEDLAVQKIEKEKIDVYVCERCGWTGKGFEPKKCTVCGAPPREIKKLDNKALDELEGSIIEEKTFDSLRLKWTADARDLLKSLPNGYQQRRARAQIEKTARVRKISMITKEMVAPIVGHTQEITDNLQERGKLKQTASETATPKDQNVRDGKYSWTSQAIERLNRIPEGFMRSGTRKRTEKVAAAKGVDLIDLAVLEEGIKQGLEMMEEMIKKQKKSE